MRKILRALCALALLAATPAGAEVRIVDGDTLEIDGTVYRLHGIDAPEAGQRCTRADGRPWDCGKAAAERLRALTRGRPARCIPRAADAYGRVIARCLAGGRDLAETMVAEGLAWAFRRYAQDYLPAEARARAARRGIWQGAAQPAWEFRRARWEQARSTAPAGCPIKGNISRNGRIYHPPWSPWYDRTRVSPENGERWFCDEGEARAAGFRPPRLN